MQVYQYLSLGKDIAPTTSMHDIITAIHNKKSKLMKVSFTATLPFLPMTMPPVSNSHEALIGLAIDSYSSDDEDWKKWDKSLLSSLGTVMMTECITVAAVHS